MSLQALITNTHQNDNTILDYAKTVKTAFSSFPLLMHIDQRIEAVCTKMFNQLLEETMLILEKEYTIFYVKTNRSGIDLITQQFQLKYGIDFHEVLTDYKTPSIPYRNTLLPKPLSLLSGGNFLYEIKLNSSLSSYLSNDTTNHLLQKELINYAKSLKSLFNTQEVCHRIQNQINKICDNLLRKKAETPNKSIGEFHFKTDPKGSELIIHHILKKLNVEEAIACEIFKMEKAIADGILKCSVKELELQGNQLLPKNLRYFDFKAVKTYEFIVIWPSFPLVPCTGNFKQQTPSIYENSLLAEKIKTYAKQEFSFNVKALCLNNFLINPTYHLMNKMIKRGVGRFYRGDNERALVISQIPNFIEQVSSFNYLRSFAIYYFKNKSNKIDILKIFDSSLLTATFQEDLKRAVDKFKSSQDLTDFCVAEDLLRIPLTIFRQSASLQEYTYPEEADYS